jgi:hypothetical protein
VSPAHAVHILDPGGPTLDHIGVAAPLVSRGSPSHNHRAAWTSRRVAARRGRRVRHFQRTCCSGKRWWDTRHAGAKRPGHSGPSCGVTHPPLSPLAEEACRGSTATETLGDASLRSPAGPLHPVAVPTCPRQLHFQSARGVTHGTRSACGGTEHMSSSTVVPGC